MCRCLYDVRMSVYDVCVGCEDVCMMSVRVFVCDVRVSMMWGFAHATAYVKIGEQLHGSVLSFLFDLVLGMKILLLGSPCPTLFLIRVILPALIRVSISWKIVNSVIIQ